LQDFLSLECLIAQEEKADIGGQNDGRNDQKNEPGVAHFWITIAAMRRAKGSQYVTNLIDYPELDGSSKS
jgi:hypothetical protein